MFIPEFLEFHALSNKGRDLYGLDLEEREYRTAAEEDALRAEERDVRADILVTTTFEGEGQIDLLVDHTTSSIHVPSNCLQACKKEKLVDKIEKR